MKTNSDFKRRLDRSLNFRVLNDDKNEVIVLPRWLFPESNEEKHNYILCMKWKITSVLANRIKCNLIRLRSGPWSTMMKCGAICGCWGVSQRWGRKPTGLFFGYFSCFLDQSGSGLGTVYPAGACTWPLHRVRPFGSNQDHLWEEYTTHKSMQEWFFWELRGRRLTVNSACITKHFQLEVSMPGTFKKHIVI